MLFSSPGIDQVPDLNFSVCVGVCRCRRACGVSQIYSAHLIVGREGGREGGPPRPPRKFIKHWLSLRTPHITQLNSSRGGKDVCSERERLLKGD